MKVKSTIKDKDIKNLVKAISDKYSVKVGLLAGKGGNDDVGENLDLAGLGAIQEFGCTITVTDKMRAFLRSQGLFLKNSTKQITIPARSFLSMPIMQTKLFKQKLQEKIGNTDDFMEYAIRTGDFKSVAVIIGASALELIQEAFATGGFGQWEANHPLTIAQKGSAMPLVDTGRLSKSVTFQT